MTSFKFNIILISLILCTGFCTSIAQTITKPKVIKSEIYKSTRDWDLMKLEYTNIIGIAYDSIGNSYMLKSDPRQKDKLAVISIEIFDNNLKLLLTKQIEVPVEAEHYYTIESYSTFNNTPTLFYSQFQKDKSKKVFYFLQFDRQGNFSNKGKMIEVSTIEAKQDNFEIIQSKNKKAFMIVAYPTEKAKNKKTASCLIFNDRIEKLKTFNVDFQNTSDNIDRLDWTLTEDGLAFCLLDEKDPKSKNHYSSLIIYADADSPTKFDVNKKDGRVYDLMISLEDKDEITFVGNYVGIEHNLSQGVVFIKIGKTDKKIKIVKSYQFSDEILTFFRIKPTIPLASKGILYQTPYWANATQAKNSFLVIGKFVTYFKSKTDFTNVSNSFVVIKFDPNGELIFEKIQPFGCSAYIGHEGTRPHYFIMGEELGVLHNNKEKNIEKIKKGVRTDGTVCTSVSHANSGLGKRGAINLYIQAFNSTGQSRFIQLTNYESDQISITNNPTIIRKDNSMVVGVIGPQSYGLMKFNF